MRNRFNRKGGGFKETLFFQGNFALHYLSSINDICRKQGIEFIVVIIPDELQINHILQKEVIDTLSEA